MVEEMLKRIKTKDDGEKFMALLADNNVVEYINELPDFDRFFLCEKIKEKAKIVKKIGLWNVYFKNKIKKSTNAEDVRTYTCPLNGETYYTGAWYVCGEGITKQVGESQVCAAYQPIIITKRFVNIEDDIEKFELTYCDNGTWRTKNISRVTLSSTNSVTKLVDYGISIAPSNASHFCNYINEFYVLNVANIPTIQSISRLGWVNDDFKEFLPYTDSDVVCDVEGEFKKIGENFKSQGSYEVWKSETEKARKNINVRLYTDASFASPLIKMLGINGFIVHLYGDRGKGKTVSLILGMSIWGNPRLGKLTNSINNTMYALECRAEFLQNLPFSGDELQNMDTREINNDALIYMVANGSGRGRGDKDRSLKRQKSWNLIMMTTGEIPITSDTSRSGCKVRCVEIQNNHEMYEDIDLVDFTEKIKANYGFAGREFIQHIINIGKEELLERFENIKKEVMALSGDQKLDSKQLNATSVLKLADDLVGESIFSEQEPIPNEMILGLVKGEDEIDVAARAYDYIVSEIIRDRSSFDDAETEESESETRRKIRMKTNGKIDFEKQYAIVNFNYLEECLRKKYYTFDMVKEKWAEYGLIKIYKGKKYYASRKDYGTSVKFIRFTEDVGDDDEVDLTEEPPF